MLKLIKSYLKGYNLQLVLVTLCVIVVAAADLLMPTYLSKIVDVGIANKDINYILTTGGIMLLISLLGAFATVCRSFFATKISVGFAKDLREKIFKNSRDFSLTEMDKFGASSLLTRTTNDVNQVQNIMIMFFRMVMIAPIKIIGSIYMAYRISPELSMTIIWSIPVIGVLLLVIAKFAVPLSSQMQKKTDRINLILREKLSGVRVIRAFNTVDHEEERFHEANKDFTDTSIKMMKIVSFMFPALSLITNVTTISLVWVGALQVSYGNIMVGNILEVIQYVMQIMFSLMMIAMIFTMIPRGTVSAQRIQEVIETTSAIKDKENANTTALVGSDLSFNGVTFSYPDAKEPVLCDITFTAKEGETTAIIGSTGSGKTTLINLMLRFYDVTKGSITLGGVDIRDISTEKLRDTIGYVPQKALLFEGEISSNLRMADGDATEEQMLNALGIAQATGFIAEKGLSGHVSRGGVNFSGGQKQRLSIARALTRQCPIYIFDDSFSALDYTTDSKLRKALDEKVSSSGKIVVAQRVSSIKDRTK